MHKLLIIVASLFLTTAAVVPTSPAPYYDGDSYNPCGAKGIQRDSLTAYIVSTFDATYKDLAEEETLYFLEQLKLKNSRISNIRIFKSSMKPDYALSFSYLFQSFLEGKVLVELYCIERVNGSSVLYMTDEGIEKFIGKPFSEIGLGEKEE